MTHAHARLSALVDGELDHQSRDRILVHLAHCDECRAAAESERQIKALLAGMSAPAPSSRLHAMLLGVAASDDSAAGQKMAAQATAQATQAATAEQPTAEQAMAARAAGGPASPGAAGSSWRGRPQARFQSMPRRTRLALSRRPPGQLGPRGPHVHPVRRPSPSLGTVSMTGAAAVEFRGASAAFGGPPLSAFPRRLRRRVVAGVAGMAAMAGLAAIAALATGGDTAGGHVVPTVRPYSVEPADVVSDIPLSDPGAVTAVLERERSDRSAGH